MHKEIKMTRRATCLVIILSVRKKAGKISKIQSVRMAI